MKKNSGVDLGNHFEAFINKQVMEGRFGSADEVIRAGLRLLEEEENKLEALRASLEAGEKSGFAEGYSLNEVMHKLDRF